MDGTLKTVYAFHTTCSICWSDTVKTSSTFIIISITGIQQRIHLVSARPFLSTTQSKLTSPMLFLWSIRKSLLLAMEYELTVMPMVIDKRTKCKVTTEI